MARVAFIGLGHMGGGMAPNLAKAGHDVRAFDLSAEALAPSPCSQVFSLPNMPATTNTVAEKPTFCNVGTAVLKKSSYPSSNVNPTSPLASPERAARYNSRIETPRRLCRLR